MNQNTARQQVREQTSAPQMPSSPALAKGRRTHSQYRLLWSLMGAVAATTLLGIIYIMGCAQVKAEGNRAVRLKKSQEALIVSVEQAKSAFEKETGVKEIERKAREAGMISASEAPHSEVH